MSDQVRLDEFIRGMCLVSKFYGAMPNVVQSGGGNISGKYDGKMFIKSSGIQLSDVSSMDQFAEIDLNGLLSVFKIKSSDYDSFQKRMERKIAKNTITSKVPSIETSMHVFLDDFVLHTHPTSILSIITNKNARKNIQSILTDTPCLIIKYKNPGVLLAQEIYKQMESYEKRNKFRPKIIFLLNHGLIVHSDNINEVRFLQDAVLDRANKFLNIADEGSDNRAKEMDSYQWSILATINTQEPSGPIGLVYKSDMKLSNYIKDKKQFRRKRNISFFPDKVVYCDEGIFIAQTADPCRELLYHYARDHTFPIIIIINDVIFILARNLSKAREIEDVLRAHLEILLRNPDKSLVRLTNKETMFLKNWDAEEYRKKI